MAKDKAAQQVSAEKVQSYTDAFTLITEATGISDVDVLVATFVNAEDENYRLFKYVEELNQEIAKLEEQARKESRSAAWRGAASPGGYPRLSGGRGDDRQPSSLSDPAGSFVADLLADFSLTTGAPCGVSRLVIDRSLRSRLKSRGTEGRARAPTVSGRRSCGSLRTAWPRRRARRRRMRPSTPLR